MQISQTNTLPDGRDHYPIGRIWGASDWRVANGRESQADRCTALCQLIREAEEYGADAVVRVEFYIDDVTRAETEGPMLLRIAATGIAVKFRQADRTEQRSKVKCPRDRARRGRHLMGRRKPRTPRTQRRETCLLLRSMRSAPA
jgi:hypothetical protein